MTDSKKTADVKVGTSPAAASKTAAVSKPTPASKIAVPPVTAPSISSTPLPPKTVTEMFGIAGAKTKGNYRFQDGSNGQDAIHRMDHDSGEFTVLAVCDGCGDEKLSQSTSEVGAILGGQLLVKAIYDHVAKVVVEDGLTLDKLKLRDVQSKWADIVKAICEATAANPSEWHHDAEDMFYFTIVGAIVTQNETLIFSVGDGFYSLNGNVVELESDQKDPNYPIYPTMPNLSKTIQNRSWIKSTPVIKTGEVSSLILATDGARFLPDLNDLSGYQDTVSLRGALDKYQRPYLVSQPAELVINQGKIPRTNGQSGSRVDMQAKATITVASSFSAHIKGGQIADDLAVIVMTKPGAVRKSYTPPSRSTPLAEERSDDGGLMGALSQIGRNLFKKT